MPWYKKIALSLIFSTNAFFTFSQCNEWEKFMDMNNVFPNDITRDRFGNTYIVGNFIQTFTIGGVTVPLLGDHSLFILKFRKDHSVEWAKSIGGLSYAFRVQIDNFDNPVVVGAFFDDHLDFDCISIRNYSRLETFVTKYSPDGTVQWAIGSQGLDDGFYEDIAITKSNNIILTGSFISDGFTLEGKSVVGSGGYDSFIANILPDGKVNWIRSIYGESGVNPDYITCVDTDSKENIVVTGFFESDFLKIDNFKIPKKNISENYFIAQFDKTGEALWASGSPSQADASGMDIVVDKSDNIYVGGHFYNNDFKIGNDLLLNNGKSDMFLAQYDQNGSIIRTKSYGGSYYDQIAGLEIDLNGDVVISGYFGDSFLFDNTPVSAIGLDGFVATLDQNTLAIKCLHLVSGNADVYNTILRIDKSGNVLALFTNPFMIDNADYEGKFTSSNYATAALIGHVDNFDAYAPGQGSLSINLGNDITKCNADAITLDAGQYCSASYLWSNGSTNQTITTTQNGRFWVEVKVGNKVGKDTIQIDAPQELNIDLGLDRFVCKNEMATLSVTAYPETTYLWNDGSTDTSLQVNGAGIFWVKAAGLCESITDSINVFIQPPMDINLGPDRRICKDEILALSVQGYTGTVYTWDNGTSSTTRDVNQAGIYWVKASNACDVVADSVSVSLIIPMVIDLGPDTVICQYNRITLGHEVSGASSYTWQDGSQSSTLVANSPGHYFVEVSNQCETVRDDLTISLYSSGDLFFPTVITPGDGKDNERFILDEKLQNTSLLIYDRWGTEVYKSDKYLNDWDATNLSQGTYFLKVNSPCLQKPYIGWLDVLK